jgi:hypothetical protein
MVPRGPGKSQVSQGHQDHDRALQSILELQNHPEPRNPLKEILLCWKYDLECEHRVLGGILIRIVYCLFPEVAILYFVLVWHQSMM